MKFLLKLLLNNLIFSISICVEDYVPLITKECREKDRLISSKKEDFYAIVDALEGQTLFLRCRFCNAEVTDSPKNWYKVDQLGVTEPYEVKIDMGNDINQNRISVNHKHSLIIKNISAQDAGFYYCVHYEDQTNNEKFNYLVDIVVKEKAVAVETGNITAWAKYQENYFFSINNLFKESSGTEFVYIRDQLHISMELITQWAPWSKCQVCGRPQGNGIMKRKGMCRIKLGVMSVLPGNLSAGELYLFKAPAVSCRSTKLQRMFPQISNLTSVIPDFVQDDRCDGICNPDAEGVNKGWKVGKGTGFKYRKRLVLAEHSHLTFVCPESSLDNSVVWKRNGMTLKRGDNSNPHVMVDTFNSLYLVDVTPFDKGNYSCYVDDIRMQQIIVFVFSKTKLLTKELVRYLIYLGYILFLSSFCYCGGLIVTCQRRHLFKTYKELKEEETTKSEEDTVNLI
ncbi:uncharacterized protein LOC115889268 isoform X2 [Sitophilus oryzae]|uniref:Uncharacterized protein LOC115889268 isoform X2 n=1 Tax=Sitophilus oryzae TaxID=7048 RepID=A0A6J2YQL1_SITOR|nr:uncharacterized protein LOC115889268 isoform X2 [Sitophilus oryzae]